jgi:hypothetical protein
LRVYPGCDGSHNISDDLLSGTKDIEIEWSTSWHLSYSEISTSAFALYIEHFAYYCGFYFFRWSPHQVTGTHLPPVWDLLLALALGYKESQFYVSFKGQGNQNKVTCPRLQARWSATVLNPRCSDQESDTLTITSRPRCPSIQKLNDQLFGTVVIFYFVLDLLFVFLADAFFTS